MIFELSRTTDFPDPRFGDKSGFYAIGGDISPERLFEPWNETLKAEENDRISERPDDADELGEHEAQRLLSES